LQRRFKLLEIYSAAPNSLAHEIAHSSRGEAHVLVPLQCLIELSSQYTQSGKIQARRIDVLRRHFR